NMFSKSFEYLSQLNGYLITNICNYIGIKTTIESDSTNKYLELERKLLKIDENDYSHFRYMEKTRPEKKVARILEICKTENATTYINAIGGQNLYSNEEFSKYGIDLKFIQTEEFEYPQFSQDFQPNLSIVDVLMHNGSVGTKKLLQKHTLI
ncbi:MAG: WbqC family protein, partial [Phycisphaerae bacterium]